MSSTKRNRVLATGEPRMPLAVRRWLSPQRNHQLNRAVAAIQEPLLHMVPRSLRLRWPLDRFYWQQREVDVIQARAQQLAKEYGWDEGR